MSVTAESLRNTLNQTIEKLLAGEIDVAQANAVGNLASKITDTAKAEVYAAKTYSDMVAIDVPRSKFLIESKKS